MNEGHTETHFSGSGPGASGSRRPAASCFVWKGAAADHADFSFIIARIRTPLARVAVHVVQAPWVGLLQANLVGILLVNNYRIAVEPAVLAQLLFIIAK